MSAGFTLNLGGSDVHIVDKVLHSQRMYIVSSLGDESAGHMRYVHCEYIRECYGTKLKISRIEMTQKMVVFVFFAMSSVFFILGIR